MPLDTNITSSGNAPVITQDLVDMIAKQIHADEREAKAAEERVYAVVFGRVSGQS